jgi:hypothetical protein
VVKTEQRERSRQTQAHHRRGTAARNWFTLLTRHGLRGYAILEWAQIAVVYFLKNVASGHWFGVDYWYRITVFNSI